MMDLTPGQLRAKLDETIECLQGGAILSDATYSRIEAAVERACWGGRLGEFGQCIMDRFDLIISYKK